MELLPTIELPKEFCQLLQMKLSIGDGASSNSTLYQYISQSETLSALVELNFGHLHPKGKVHHFLRTLGWKNFRDRLASIYLHYLHYQAFPGITTTSLVSDVVHQEMQFEKYSTGSNSRLFLFFYYLKLTRSQHGHQSIMTFPEDLEEILVEMRFKSDILDWILLILWHFHTVLGKKRLYAQLKHQKESFRFGTLFQQLSISERRTIISNLLSYSHSIQDSKLFTDLITY